MLQARGLTKRYGGLLALDRVDFDLQPGEIVGYLGPNGSGKSTTVNIVVGLLEPTAGSIMLDGVRASDDPIAYKRRVGYVPEEPSLYAHLTAAEYLMLVGRLRRMPARTLAARVLALLTLFELYDSRYRSMTAFSKGMRQRVLVSAALLHNPDLIVLDEPFSGLDVSAGLLLRTLLRLLAEGGRMILFSTHRFDMVEKLCSRVVILSAGRVAAEGRIADFARSPAGSLEETFVRATQQPDYEPLARKILQTITED
jgi:ABC-2 type transport system ATP-binding protein